MEEIHLKKIEKCVVYANLYKLPLERGYLSMLCRIILIVLWTQPMGMKAVGDFCNTLGYLELSAAVMKALNFIMWFPTIIYLLLWIQLPAQMHNKFN